MTFSQFIEYLLWRLYLQEAISGAGQFYDFNEFANELFQPVDQQWVIDAGKVLESRGLARCLFALGGYTSGMLTGEGRLYVEERLNQDGSFFKLLTEHPEEYMVVPGLHEEGDDPGELAHALQVEPAAKSLEEQREPVNRILDEIVEAIQYGDSAR